MQKFMLIVREDLSVMRDLTPEQRFAGSPDMNGWVNSLVEVGKYITGQPFAIEGYYVSKTGADADGKFLRDKEGISGFDLIFANDLNEALEIARSCPMVKMGMAIREVRPFQEFPE
ncbi:MAG TPA: YciI family protein [Chryseolinea sp.]|nr:YciI family protein [Chryseolinea sp.]